jgi:tetratricopeptide (TPR) repeat protein
MSIEALKEQARRHEQREEWRAALDLYRKAISRQEQEDQADIALYNRVGDLQTRLGELESAAEAYERAVDLYVESELHNNAIAVCKKIVRHLPGRASAFLRMGQIRAGQGFLVDARQNFLAYAERMQALGDIDEAFRALIEFADLAPEDMEVRLAIAAQMEQRDRRDDAVEQLAIGYVTLQSLGRDEDAEAFADKIFELDPDADLSSLATAPATGRKDEADVGRSEPGLAELSYDDGPAESPSDETSPIDGALQGEFTIVPRSAEEGGIDPDQVEGFEATALGGLAEIEAREDGAALDPQVAPAEDDTDGEADSDLAPLPLLEPAGEESSEATAAPDEALVEEPDSDAVTSFAEVEPAVEDVDQPDVASFGEATDEVEELIAAGDYEEALKVVRGLMESEPGNTAHPQRLVELAFRVGDDGVLTEGYLALAACLEAGDQSTKAQAVYRQVLSLDPENEVARAALAGATDAGTAAQEVASSEDYVDLGALVLDEEDAEKTTRFVVAYEEPSGDEAADFAKMLSQFKKKVAENVSVDDVRAHHDLGTAYREMGLYDEAIQEYQQALRASASHLPTYELLGQCFIDKGQYEAAVRSLSRALDVPRIVEDELIGIYYYLGRAHESLGNTDSALEFYDRVFTLDINFADVTERLRALR